MTPKTMHEEFEDFFEAFSHFLRADGKFARTSAMLCFMSGAYVFNRLVGIRFAETDTDGAQELADEIREYHETAKVVFSRMLNAVVETPEKS